MSAGSFDTRRLGLLALLTLAWGLNWPVMKLGISGFPPLSFRAISIWLGLPLLAAVVRVSGLSFRVPAAERGELFKLTVSNMLVWHLLAIVCLQALSSGRAAILAYTMPIFAALWGVTLYGQRLGRRPLAGVAAAAVGVALLLWHELGRMAGTPWAAGGMLVAAATWALGTQQLRRTTMTTPMLVVIFWMTLATAVMLAVLAVVFEHGRWVPPPAHTWAAIVYNALLIFAFAQPVWLWLARTLPPMASSLSVMMIPVLGVVSGALWLREVLHWQDVAAIALMMVAIGSVLLPARAPVQRA